MEFTGKSAGCPAFLLQGRGGNRPYNHIFISRKPRPVGGELFHYLPILIRPALANFSDENIYTEFG